MAKRKQSESQLANLEKGKKTQFSGEIAARAAQKAAEAKRARKTLREELLALMGDDLIQERICIALVKEAMEGNRSGSVTKAFETIRDTIGEKPSDRVELAGTQDLQVNITVKE